MASRLWSQRFLWLCREVLSCQLTATAWMHYCVGVMLALVSSPAQDVVVRFSSPCDSDKFASEAKLQVSCMQVRDQRGHTRLDHGQSCLPRGCAQRGLPEDAPFQPACVRG